LTLVVGARSEELLLLPHPLTHNATNARVSNISPTSVIFRLPSSAAAKF
jgi:hypothetical protein